MKISIVIPIFNVENYITACIHSVMNQDYTGEMECLLIDDCGTDNSILLAEECISTNRRPNIHFRIIHHQRNRGLSAARNTGVDAATGEYVYFLDSDDTMTPDAIQQMVAPMVKRKYDFVTADYNAINSDEAAPTILLEEGEYIGNQCIVNSYHTQWYAMAWNKLLSLDFIKRNSLFFKEGLIHEDELWSFKLACVATSMYVQRKRTYNYLLKRTDSIISGTNRINKIKAFLHVIEGWAKIANNYSHNYSQEHLYYLLEMTKRNTYIESYSCMNLSSRKELYKKLRTLRLPQPKDISLLKKLVIMIRDIHSNPLIPQGIGFIDMELITKLAVFIRKIKSHRNG